MKAKKNIALGGVFIFFFLLFNAPFLSLPTGRLFGVPALMVYILILWVLLIIIMALMDTKRKPE